jgi:hypothetical protein
MLERFECSDREFQFLFFKTQSRPWHERHEISWQLHTSTLVGNLSREAAFSALPGSSTRDPNFAFKPKEQGALSQP